MSTQLKFEFDFDEVFEGIRLGVIKEMTEMSIEDIKTTAVNQVKSEITNKISLTYRDEYELRDEIKKEIKKEVYKKLISDIKNEYKKKYEDSFGEDITNALDDVEEEIIDRIEKKTINKLYDDLYLVVQKEIKTRINDSLSKIINTLTGNNINVKNTETTITKEEYKSLVDRDKKLTALENGGVDNWEWYGESLRDYFGDENA